MNGKGSGSHPNTHKAGEKNLAKWQSDNPGWQSEVNLTHGAHSQSIRKRYDDMRTSEGKRLKAIMDQLIDNLGGHQEVNAGQNVILGNLRAKFIVVFQISKYLERQSSIIDAKGELLACLGKNFLAYSESIRRDLEALYSMAAKRPTKLPTIDDLMKGGN